MSETQRKEGKTPEQIANEVFAVAKYLRNPSVSGLRIREAVLNGKRVEYFKGRSAVNALLRDAYKHPSRPEIPSRLDAWRVMEGLLMRHMFVRCDKDDKVMTVNKVQKFDEEYYFAWLYEGSQLKPILGGIALVAVVLAFVMYPLWPPTMRIGAWYLSMAGLGFLGLLFVLAIVRLILFVITYAALPPGIWLFPNLFEDVGFFESFVPLYAWHVLPGSPSVGQPSADGAGDAATASGSDHRKED